MISLSFCVKFDVDCLLMFVKIKKELFIEKNWYLFGMWNIVFN